MVDYSIVAVADTQISKVESAFREYTNILNRARDAESYHKPGIEFYVAARHKLIAVSLMIDALAKFVSEHVADFDNYDIYVNQVSSLASQLSAYETNAVVPGLSAAEATNEVIKGVVTVVEDGDSFLIGERTFRMAGIDAPEIGTPRGKVSGKVLSDMILGKEITCFVDVHNPIDVYGRVLTVVYLGDTNVNVDMIRRCQAAPNLKFGKHKYVDDEEVKQAANKCLFSWPELGIVKIRSDPTNAAIYIDGEYSGYETPTSLELATGKYRISLVAAGRSSLYDQIVVKPGDYDSPHKYILPKLSTGMATVSIGVSPESELTEIYVDGLKMGIAPILLDLSSSVPVELRAVSPLGEVTEMFSPVQGVINRVTLTVPSS